MKIAMCVFLLSFLGTLQTKTLKLVKAQNLISARFSEAGEKQNTNKKLPFRKSRVQAAAIRNSIGARTARGSCPFPSLPNFWTATGLGLATLGLLPPPKIIARGVVLAGSHISVWGAEQWVRLSHGHWGV